MASLTNLHDSQRNTVDTNTFHGAQDQVDASTFPQGAPQMPRAGWTGAMWAESTAAAQQGQAGAGGVGLQQQQPPYAQPGHPGQQFSTQQQFPGQQPQYAQQPAQYAQPGQQMYDPNAQYQQQQFPGAGPSQQPPYAGAPQYQYAQQYPPQQQQPQQAQQQFAPAAGPVYDVPGAQPPQAAYAGYAPQGGQPWNSQLGMAPGMQLQVSPTGQLLGARSEDKPVAPQRACTRCKRLKVRCEPVNGERPCKRCRNANAECETAPRKQRPKYGYGGSEDEEEQ